MWLVITFILGGICGIFGMALLFMARDIHENKEYLKLKDDYYKLQLKYDKLLKELRYYKGIATRYNQIIGLQKHRDV